MQLLSNYECVVLERCFCELSVYMDCVFYGGGRFLSQRIDVFFEVGRCFLIAILQRFLGI